MNQPQQLASCTHPYPPVELNSDNTVELRTLATLQLSECNLWNAKRIQESANCTYIKYYL